jgi:DNA-binding protein H-NS
MVKVNRNFLMSFRYTTKTQTSVLTTGHAMNHKSIIELEQELAAYQAEAARLQTVIAAAKKSEHVGYVARVRQLMTELGVTMADLTPTEASKEKRTRAGKSEKVPPKYINAETNVTWSGRGATPHWLKAYEAAGRNREEFLINKIG